MRKFVRGSTRIACAAALVAASGVPPAKAVEAQVQEGETATIQVKRPGESWQQDFTWTYEYSTHGGSAQTYLDFGPVSGKLTFGPGVNWRKVEIETYEDACDESDETFHVKLKDGTCSVTTAGYTAPCGSPPDRTFTVRITNVEPDGSDSYLNTAQGCSGGSSGSTFGE